MNETENNEQEMPEPPSCDWCSNDTDTVDDDGNDVREQVERRGDIEQICTDCYENYHQSCDQCGDAICTDGDSYEWYHDEVYCSRCTNRYLSYCHSCEELHHVDDDLECGDNGSGGIIRGYSKTGAFVFLVSAKEQWHSEREGMVFMGPELEIEAVNGDLYDIAQIAHDIFGPHHCELKEDGSLNNGLEIVGQPMTLEYIRNVFPYKRLLELRDAGARSADTKTCGLHVHINRGFFNNRYTSMYRFMSMFHYNNEMWKKIAGRGDVIHCSWSDGGYEKERMLDYVRYAVSKGMNGVRNNYERYIPINLQNSNTIELRFFRGTLRPEVFLARLEAVDAVARYSIFTRNSINIKKAYDWGTFRSWAEDNGYEAFTTHATNKGV